MAKYHINKKGIPAVCRAKDGNCPLGGNEQHFGTKEDAQKFADEKNKELFGLIQKEPNPKIRYHQQRIAEIEKYLEENKEVSQENIDNFEREIDYHNHSIENQREGIFFDSRLIDMEDDEDIYRDELQFALEEYTNKPRGEVYEFALLSRRESHYGAAGKDGKRGFMRTKTANLYRAAMRAGEKSDTMTLKDNNGNLELSVGHHDGKDICEVKVITKSRIDEYDRIMNSGDTSAVIEYLSKLPSLTIKKDKRLNP